MGAYSAEWADLEPIRSELFGVERLKQHARSLAQSQNITETPPPVKDIVSRLNDNAETLLSAYHELCANVSRGAAITPASEWLIDNYHVVEEHVRQIRNDLTPGFYRQLPKLADGHLAGHPRIFAIVWGYVAHVDSYFRSDTLTEYIAEYQKISTLTVGELWAVAISLRLILIENFRRISERIIISLRERAAADAFADSLQLDDVTNPTIDQDKRQLPIIKKDVSLPYAVRLVQRLKDLDTTPPSILNTLQKRMQDKGFSLDDCVNLEHQRQSAANVTVRNIVTSLKLITDVNWENWFDSVSLVDQLLRERSIFGEMDFASRTLYRNAVEELARGSAHDEITIARKALEFLNANPQDADPGYYLIGRGRRDFEQALSFQPSWNLKFVNWLKRNGVLGYVLTLAIVSILIAVVLVYLTGVTAFSGSVIAALVATALFPASDTAIVLYNYFLSRVIKPTILPGLSLRDGVPDVMRSLVVIPTLLTSNDDIDELTDRLEVHYLANSAGEIYFALLTDCMDSTTEESPQDRDLLERAKTRIESLNSRYGFERFLLLHRPRCWNDSEGKWMGWERKRGKLMELNNLLRNAKDVSIKVVAGTLPADVKFVITLDSDTLLPRDAARRMIGKLAHPLNTPVFDSNSGRVERGHGILQPRVTPSLPLDHYGSLYQRIFSTTRGLDPYAFTVSDTYQDLFGEGTFTGKGIYNIDAFERSLEGRVPENTMLSHDLFEGTFARSGLMTDVEVVEEHPERYIVGAQRTHRWVRGDWQLLPWLLGARKIASSRTDTIPALGRWKMWDNLRRSLTPIAIMLSMLIAWAFLPAATANAWVGCLILIGFFPQLLPTVRGLLQGSKNMTLSSRLRSLSQDAVQVLALAAANLIFLSHHVVIMVDAILRTFYRLYVSHKNLLEWTTAAQASRSSSRTLFEHFRLMLASLCVGLLALLLAIMRADDVWVTALPLSLAWITAPALAFFISKSPRLQDELEAAPQQRLELRAIARRTWRYFEKFVTAEDNMLPPDNFQEYPEGIIAHRTSPTNIGLYLLAVVSAREFGWIGQQDAIDRISATLATVKKMEFFRGHLYNWYDTRTLDPLHPKYISSVDSGNLAGHLIAVANSLEAWAISPVRNSNFLDGINDIIQIAGEELKALDNSGRNSRAVRMQIRVQLDKFRAALTAAKDAPEYAPLRMIDFAVQAANIHANVTRIIDLVGPSNIGNLLHWSNVLRETIEVHFRELSSDSMSYYNSVATLREIAAELRKIAYAMDFSFLMDQQRQLLSIGYRIADNSLDESCYDMLASEARLASYFAIAKGDVKTRHWFRLGRTTTAIDGGAALISWSGSMFEYLMPPLVMRAPTAGLLDQTGKLIVRRQISYARALGIPWGISEAAFNGRDVEQTYQYSNFGIPGLGLKRGLSENVVIAPYATGLASMIDPRSAVENYRRMSDLGARGDFGFYEAMDFTPSRVPKGNKFETVQAYFAHHQGMTIAAILNAAENGLMRERFHAEPSIRSAELLLQERAPREVPVTYTRSEESSRVAETKEFMAPAPRVVDLALDALPSNTAHVLSNGQFTTVITGAGSGYSSWNGMRITRWIEDPVRDDWGSFIYLKDLRSGETWSASHMPTSAPWRSCRAFFSEDKAEFFRSDSIFSSTMLCMVSPESNAEVRKLTVRNTGVAARTLEFTSYTELALATAESDLSHPAFSKMFVETEYLPDIDALIAYRRNRSAGDPEIWVAQFMVSSAKSSGNDQFETDRYKFIGVGRDLQAPAALDTDGTLSGSTGFVMDPIFSFRKRLRVAAGQQISVTIWTMVADTREGVLNLIDQHRQSSAFDRALTMAWSNAQIRLRHLGLSIEKAQEFQDLAASLIYAYPGVKPAVRGSAEVGGSQSNLWPVGISGDLPILLIRIDNEGDIKIVRSIMQAHAYWVGKGLSFDIVILNERISSYVQDLQISIQAIVAKGLAFEPKFRASPMGKVFTLRADQVAADVLRTLISRARVTLHGRRGEIATQILSFKMPLPAKAKARTFSKYQARSDGTVAERDQLQFFNGFGGFSRDGKEYIVNLSPKRLPPAPWINVIANDNFGFHSAADGGGYTWYGNSRENQLTQWTNDPVINRQSEVCYVYDEDEQAIITPTYQPMKSAEGTHTARHGMGYTTYTRQARGLSLEMLQTCSPTDAVKFIRLKITNDTTSLRKLSVIFFAEWVMGPPGSGPRAAISTEMEEKTGAMLIQNRWNNDSANNVIFVHMDEVLQSWTSDKNEFLGPYGTLQAPAGIVAGLPLSGRTGQGNAACTALQSSLQLQSKESTIVTIRLGAAENRRDCLELLQKALATSALKAKDANQNFWDQQQSLCEIKTPDKSFDFMMNGWLLYQALSCRIKARSGFYQASGAFGFRDQLQDSLAFLNTQPELARNQLRLAASRQFETGDFQHWWLPGSGRGVRTHISDDKVWLAYCLLAYIRSTGDETIVEENVHFIEGQTVPEGVHDIFYQPEVSQQTASIYEHCARALDASLAVGEHGLPLIGTGDWNDGFNRVGEAGKGESVWLAWFLLATLRDFIPWAMKKGDVKRAEIWQSHCKDLRAALESHGWDGKWYRRGFFDDGSILGSATSEECKIDAISQSWAVLSEEAPDKRARQAMEQSFNQLVQSENALMRLFTPPFNASTQEPGYVKAYPPGVRENGGQYTHGVIWSVFAFAKLGEEDTAYELFQFFNPVNHARTREDAQRYRVEPYVVAADVYSVGEKAGRGGWTWYTGSAGWLYRAGLEAILGITKEAGELVINPSIPTAWPGCEVKLRFGNTTYQINMARDQHTAPNQLVSGSGAIRVPLVDDGDVHVINIKLPDVAQKKLETFAPAAK